MIYDAIIVKGGEECYIVDTLSDEETQFFQLKMSIEEDEVYRIRHIGCYDYIYFYTHMTNRPEVYEIKDRKAVPADQNLIDLVNERRRSIGLQNVA